MSGQFLVIDGETVVVRRAVARVLSVCSALGADYTRFFRPRRTTPYDALQASVVRPSETMSAAEAKRLRRAAKLEALAANGAIKRSGEP
jgi:hypothetical protein